MDYLRITTKHDGKMENMVSISTSSMGCEFCKQMAKEKNSICSRCYAQRTIKRRPTMHNKYEKNAEILMTEHDNKGWIPNVQCYRYVRLEAFGELRNETHLRNYIKVVDFNPETMFTLFTKRIDILRKVFSEIDKPLNLNIVLSSPIINQQTEILPTDNEIIDTIFTVYDKKFVEKNNIVINCGRKKCIDCMQCYKKKWQNDKPLIINELLK